MSDSSNATNHREWLNRQQAAEYLGMSVRTLDRLNLPRTKPCGSNLVRYHRAALDEHLLSNCTSQPEGLPADHAGPLRLNLHSTRSSNRGKASDAARRRHYLSLQA